jgi:hypothetical protein
MGRDSVKDSVSQRSAETLVEGRSNVFNVIVVLSILENTELLVDHFVPLLDGHVAALNFVHNGNSQLVHVLLSSLNCFLIIGSLELASHFSLIITVSKVLVSELEDHSSIFVALGSSERLEDSLGKRTAFVFATLVLTHTLNGGRFVFLKSLHVLEEVFVLIFAGSVQFSDLQFVIGNVNIFELFFLLL